MRVQSRFARAALSVLVFGLLVSVASLSQAAVPQDQNKDLAASKHTAKRTIDKDAPWTFDQQATDTRQQIRDRLSMDRSRGGSLLSRLREWLSRPADIGLGTGETTGSGKPDDDDPGSNGKGKGDDDDEEEEDDTDTESPVIP